MSVFCGNVRKFAAKLFKQDSMKRFSARLCALIVGAATLASCLNDKDDVVLTYNDMAITDFTLGTLNRYIHTTSTKTGNDTIIKTTVTGASYPMTIDHLNKVIYNSLELPVGTDINHVLCTINTKNAGVVAIQSMTSDSLKWYSKTDSISFAQPRVFKIFSVDGSGSRDYTVRLNVSSETGVTFGWRLMKTDDSLAGWTDKRLVALGDTVMLADCDSIVAASSTARYTISTDGQLKSSRDGGATWQVEPLDDELAFLPLAGTTASVCWPYAPADNTDYVLLVGRPQQNEVTTMRVWRKIAPQEGGGQWVYMPFDDSNRYQLPVLDHLSLAYFDGTVLALGSDLVMRASRDQGISWHLTGTYALPKALTGAQVLMTNDTQGRLWLLTNTGQLWRGYTSE